MKEDLFILLQVITQVGILLLLILQAVVLDTENNNLGFRNKTWTVICKIHFSTTDFNEEHTADIWMTLKYRIKMC